uniref:Dipeptidylpeptidase IV N-terminal domain-containing protein n=1 Tax=Megaselia scalaris TaxID=36166 RepID=T1GZY3_MEGSC
MAYLLKITLFVLFVWNVGARDIPLHQHVTEFGASANAFLKVEERESLKPNGTFHHPNNPLNKSFALDPKTGTWTRVKSKDPESSEDTLIWNQNNDIFLTR